MTAKVTKESQNQSQFDVYMQRGPVTMGPWTSHIWRTDPRHLGFVLARYKFCSKLLIGKSEVLEVGCGDGFGMPVVLQTVQRVHGVDFEPLVLAEAQKHIQAEFAGRCSFSVHDMLQGPVPGKYDAAYSLDVIEHIRPTAEVQFLTNICGSLKSDAICILGTPNVHASKYASGASAEGHINLKSSETLRGLLSTFFHNVFIFSMNDEVIHTGFCPMAHYLFGFGVGLKG